MSLQTYDKLLQALSAMLIELNTLHLLVAGQTQDAVDGGEGSEGSEGSARISLAEQKQGLSSGLGVLERMVREALALVRLSVDEQLPDALVGVTLAEALSRLIEETAERLGLSSRVSFSGVDEQGYPTGETLTASAERLLYLVARELLYHLVPLREAHRLRLVLNYEIDTVLMSIEDDGLVPLPTEDGATSSTQPAPPLLFEPMVSDEARILLPIIADLRSRIELLGGTLEVVRLPERGTRTLVRLPYVLQRVSTDEAVSVAQGGPAALQSSSGAVMDAKVPVIRLLLVENQAVTRVGLRHLLTAYEGIQVVGEAVDGVQAVSEALELGPQVVLMDTQLPDGQSLEALRQIKQLNLDSKVLLFAAQDREEYLYEALRAGADGYVLKDIAPDELLQAVRAVARGEILIQPQIAGRLLSRFGKQGRNAKNHDTLTARELEVLRLLARGLRNKEIAARLYVSERTVNFHLANIYQKLNVSGRTEAISKALEQGLISA